VAEVALYARTHIKHGVEDGEVLEFEPNDEVTGIDDEALQELKEAGAVGRRLESPSDEEDDSAQVAVAQLKDEVARLKAQLEAARKKPTS
jgi:hypothetical protein